jgi:hypothetical protein
MGDGPRINKRFPIRENLAPPIIERPVPQCAQAVRVSGFIPHATVRVYANVNELLAEEQPPFGFAEMTLKRAVQVGDTLSATQTVDGQTSQHSVQPAPVTPTLSNDVKATKPDVGDDLYECGVIVPVGNLVAGVRVHVLEDDVEVGNTPAAESGAAVITQALKVNGKVTAFQTACEGSPAAVKSPLSDPVTVKSAPIPPPAPSIDPGTLIVDNDAVLLTGLLVGAQVEVDEAGNPIGGGAANADADWCPVSPPLQATSSVTATQQLCGHVSPPSQPETPKSDLGAPVVLAPICASARFVVVRGTIINAVVVILRNGTPASNGGAGPGDVCIALPTSLQAGDVVTAVQYMGSTISPVSNSVTVVSRLGQPFVEILGGEPFFLPRASEQPIEGPVFPRGRGDGPSIRIQACCPEKVKASILGPDNKEVAALKLNEVFPGYFQASWPWSSQSGWSIPSDIPVGRYAVHVETGCDQKPASQPFFVIFNPADVNGPPRFSFDDTAVWFYTGVNKTYGLHYYLHQSDARVFTIAINAVSGMTDSYEAAIKLARAEEALFTYTITSETSDVLDQLLNRTEAQCADDACFLTSLMRAMGIPAHPVTADAAFETGGINWGFDTWMEFLASHDGTTAWRALHPHQYPDMMPEDRRTFGTTRGVATNETDDIIIMANEAWGSAALDDGTADVSYGRNECGQPNQALNMAPWITELCEDYWGRSHWDCTGVSTRSLVGSRGFRLTTGRPEFGGMLAGSLRVENPTSRRLFGRLAIELITHRMQDKGFTSRPYEQTSLDIELDPRNDTTAQFRFKLPRTIPAGTELYLRARLDSQTIALQPVRLAPVISGILDVPAQLAEGAEHVVTAVLRNESPVDIVNITLRVATPFALAISAPTRTIEKLRPHESVQLTWQAHAIAPLTSGTLKVLVDAPLGGGVVLRQPFKVAAKAPPPPVAPAISLRRKP